MDSPDKTGYRSIGLLPSGYLPAKNDATELSLQSRQPVRMERLLRLVELSYPAVFALLPWQQNSPKSVAQISSKPAV
jgi:hypothetical protein